MDFERRKTKILEWLSAEQNKDIDDFERISISLLHSKYGINPITDEDYSAFLNYKLSTEISFLISKYPFLHKKEFLLYGLRHKRGEVREACRNAISMQVKKGDWKWIDLLRKRNSLGCREAYRELIIKEGTPFPDTENLLSRAMEEFLMLKKISLAKKKSEFKEQYNDLKEKRLPKRSLILGKSLIYIREGKIKALLNEAKRASKEEAEILLSAIDSSITSKDFDILILEYVELNSKEKGIYENGRSTTPSFNSKLSDLANAIERSMKSEFLPSIRQAIRNIRLTPKLSGFSGQARSSIFRSRF